MQLKNCLQKLLSECYSQMEVQLEWKLGQKYHPITLPAQNSGNSSN